MSNIPHLLVHDHEDNVGVVVVEGLTAGTEMFAALRTIIQLLHSLRVQMCRLGTR